MVKPSFIIGGPDNPYLLRWHLLKSQRFLSVYVHKMLRDDDDRALHDHRSWTVSVILRGGYWEIVPDESGVPIGLARQRRIWRGPGSVIVRRATQAHRLELPHAGARSWSLFITGPTQRVWGFRPWYEFVSKDDRGAAGPGCD